MTAFTPLGGWGHHEHGFSSGSGETVLFFCEKYREGCQGMIVVPLDGGRNVISEELPMYNRCSEHGPAPSRFVYIDDPLEFGKYNLPPQAPAFGVPEMYIARR
jgi:hypothetical protein